MNVPHAIGWKEAQEANRLAALAERIYSDDLKPPCDRSALRAAWSAAVLRMGPRLILNRDKQGNPTRSAVPWRALPDNEAEAA
jgi:hypothetical protein